MVPCADQGCLLGLTLLSSEELRKPAICCKLLELKTPHGDGGESLHCVDEQQSCTARLRRRTGLFAI